MKNQNKFNVFEPMLTNFETDLIKNYFVDMIQEIPDYIFTMPSSTSGKYHNKTQCETYGQVYHAYMFSEILNPIGNLMGLDGIILMAFILGFPANETVVPIMIMGYLSSGVLSDAVGFMEIKNVLISNKSFIREQRIRFRHNGM